MAEQASSMIFSGLWLAWLLMILLLFSNSAAALMLNSGTIQSEKVMNTPSNLAL